MPAGGGPRRSRPVLARRSRRPPLVTSSILPVTLGCLAYVGTLGFDFVWDDRHLIVANSFVRQASLRSILTSDFWQEGERAGYYRPLVSLSYVGDFRLWGLSPAGYHAANVVYHLAATIAVTWVGLLLFGSGLAAVASGLTFAVHPIHTESVAFIAGRPDLMAGLLMVTALGLHIRDRPYASAGIFGLALLGKEVALVLPVTLLLYDRVRREPRDPWRRTLTRVAPHGVAVGLYALVRWLALGAPLVPGVNATPVSTRITMSLNALGDNLRLLLVPFPAAPDRIPDPVLSGHTVATFALLVLVGALASVARRYSGVPLFLLGWFLLTLLPSSPLVPGRAPQVAERFLYVPSAAWAWLVGGVWAGLAERVWARRPRGRRIAAVGAAVALVAAVSATIVRCADWRDEAHLFQWMADAEPRSYLAAVNLGYLRLGEGDLPLAEARFRKALGLKPTGSAALLGLAVVRSRVGDHSRAIEYGEHARSLAPQGDLIHSQIGAIYGNAGRFGQAADSFREAIRRNPRRFWPRAQLVLALADSGQLVDAARALAAAEDLIASTDFRGPGDEALLEQARLRLRPSIPTDGDGSRRVPTEGLHPE